MTPTEGLNFRQDVINGLVAPTPCYIGLFSGNYTPIITDTGATFPTNAVEAVDYAETARVLFVPSASTAGEADNSADVAVFTFTDTVTVHGAFLITTSAKADLTGVLVNATRFTAPKTYVSGDVLRLPWYLLAENV